MTKKNLKIAFLLGSPDISGGSNVIFHHAAGLRDKGHEVWIFTEQSFDPIRVKWHSQHKKLGFSTYADWDGGDFDIAIATWWRTAFNLPDIKARQLVYFCQSIESRFFGPFDFDMKTLVRHTYRMPMPVITESAWIADYLRSSFDLTCRVVPNGLEKKYFKREASTKKKRPFRVLVEGALGVRFKNTEKAIKLCETAGISEVYLLTNTACDSFPGVKKVYSQLSQKEVGKVYQSCDVLLKLSTVEGMFGPPLEMFHCGGTAITYKVTGHEDYLIHGENALLAEINDDAQIIEHLKTLSEDPEKLSALKSSAYRTAQDWPDWSKSVDDFESKLYELKDNNPQQTTAIHQSLKSVLWISDGLHQIEMSPYNIGDGFRLFWALLTAFFRKRPWLHESKFLDQVKEAEQSASSIKDKKIAHKTQEALRLIYEFQTTIIGFLDVWGGGRRLVVNLWRRFSYLRPKTIETRAADEVLVTKPKNPETRYFAKAWKKREIDICLVVSPDSVQHRWGEELERLPQNWSVFCLDPGEDSTFVRRIISTSRVVVFLDSFEETQPLVYQSLASGCITLTQDAPDHYWRLEWDEHFLPFNNKAEMVRRLRQILRSPDLFDVYRTRPRKVLSDPDLFF